MALEDGQYSYRGLVMGAGTDFGVRVVEGLEGTVARQSARPVPRGHGAVPGLHYQEARGFTIGLRAVGTPDTLGDLLAQLRDTFQVSTDTAWPLTFKRAGQPERRILCRPIMAPIAEDTLTVGKVNEPTIGMWADDPRLYSEEGRQVAVPLFSTSGAGIDFPINFPANWPAGVSLDAVAVNDGRADAWPTVRFYGPGDGGTVTSVTLRNLTTGGELTVVTSIGAGQILTANMRALVTATGAQVVGLDGASRYGSWETPRTPFGLTPGDNVLRFTTAGTSTDPRCVVTWRDTWLG